MLDRLVRPTTFMVVILLQSSTPAFCQVAATSFSPFVIGTIPVVGRGGAVGGVRVDPQGVLTRAELADGVELREAWLRTAKIVPADVSHPSEIRKVSLPRLDSAIARHLERGTNLPEEMLFLAGLRRVEYVFVYPEQNDVVIAGPAEGWRSDERGTIVGIRSGEPMLWLDGLMT